ncbi:MAG TPA: hypothetical protein EYM84_00965 [Flavobacteriales bacterium]|nr:hypothetical protein [Flavobacteriales bacterium]
MRLAFFFLALFLATTIAQGQKVKVDLSNENIGGGNHSAFVTTIYQVTEDDIRKEWKALLKQYKPEKVSGKAEIFADNVMISSISENTIDIYAQANQIKENYTTFIVSFDLGGIFLDANHASMKSAERIVYDFAIKTSTIGIENEIKEAEKKLLKEEKVLEKLVKENDRLHTEINRNNTAIETAKSNIEKAEKEIETNISTQETAKKLIEEQKEVVQTVINKLKSIK